MAGKFMDVGMIDQIGKRFVAPAVHQCKQILEALWQGIV